MSGETLSDSPALLPPHTLTAFEPSPAGSESGAGPSIITKTGRPTNRSRGTTPHDLGM